MNNSIKNKVDVFFSQYRPRKYKAGQILIFNGDEANHVYHLVKGRVKQYDVSYRGDEIILNVFHEPAFFPMSLVINKMPSPYIFEAETDIEVHQAPAEEVAAFITDNPDVMYDLLARVYRGTDGLLGRMAHLMASSAKDRLIYELVLEARRSGIQRQDGSYILDINEKELGARAGLTRETVSREIHKLKNSNLITVSGKNIVIKNVGELKKMLGQEA